MQSICLAKRKTPSPSGDTVANSSFSAPDLASQMSRFAMRLAQSRQFLPPPPPVFPHTTFVDPSPWQRLHHFSISFIQGSQVPSGNTDLCIPLLNLLNILGPFGIGRGPCFLQPRWSQARDATSIPSQAATSTAYCFFYIQLCHIILSKVWWSGCPARPPPQLKMQKKLVNSVVARTPRRFPQDVAARQ